MSFSVDVTTEAQRSEIVVGTSNPEWEDTPIFQFPVRNFAIQGLKVVVHTVPNMHHSTRELELSETYIPFLPFIETVHYKNTVRVLDYGLTHHHEAAGMLTLEIELVKEPDDIEGIFKPLPERRVGA